MDYPTEDEEMQVLDLAATTEDMPVPQAMVSLEALQQARQVVNRLHLDEKVKRYIVRLVQATRRPDDYGVPIAPLIRVGASPRATINLALTSRAHAFLDGRAYVTPHDVKSVAMDVLRHRVTVTYEAEAEGLNSEQIIARLLNELPVP
jgi:MoxR-like ATPase